MAESDYFWATDLSIHTYEQWLANQSMTIMNSPYGYGSFTTGLAQDIIDEPQFSNSHRKWSSGTINEALTLFQNHPEIRAGDSSIDYVTRSSYTAPTFWKSLTFTDGSEIFGGYAGIDITVELYIFTYLANSSTVTNQLRYGLIIGIPKTYDPTSTLTPAADFTPWIIRPANYSAFDPTTQSNADIFLLNIDGPVGKPSTGDTTLQLARKGDIMGTYYAQPGHESTLAKYANPVKVIRAKFATTRTAVIEDTVDGGFMIYEEVASVPSGNVYVYNSNRRLINIVDAAFIAQYRAS